MRTVLNGLANAWCMLAWCVDKVKAIRLPRLRSEMYLYIAAAVAASLLGWLVATWM